ncbi:MAG: di-trans,poly-cis-decaprenylcistransferase [Epsilonproteobacteria bacterium]|nr:MAG: di-trans,poly-cis-decaprenylcistransferase [Campylobacterota bacterium]
MSNIARHIAIIMDGNGRWAEERGLKRAKGHEQGAEVVRNITIFCSNHPDIQQLTLYAFSTENWKRPRFEVEFLMKLLERYLRKELPIYLENNTRFETLGDLSRFSTSLQNLIREIKEKTSHCDGLVQNLALNYGSHNEIIRAANAVFALGVKLTEDSLTEHLDCDRNVDLLIRTGGDHRLSNYLLWQSAYAELSFTKTLWPDFTEEELLKIIAKFTKIERRFGGLK